MLLEGCVKQGSLVALQCTLATECEDSTALIIDWAREAEDMLYCLVHYLSLSPSLSLSLPPSLTLSLSPSLYLTSSLALSLSLSLLIENENVCVDLCVCGPGWILMCSFHHFGERSLWEIQKQHSSEKDENEGGKEPP